MTTIIPYKHPFFKHDADGNIEYAYPNPHNIFGMEKHVHKLTKPLTRNDVDRHLIMALNWFKGGGGRMYDFLNIHFQFYIDPLTTEESEQPFFHFLIDLVSKADTPIPKVTYFGVMDWVRNHDLYENTVDQSDETPLSTKTNPLKIREIALLYIYQGKLIEPGTNAKSIAANYGYIKSTSGRQLREDYLLFCEEHQRTAINDSEAREFIKNIERVKLELKGKPLETADSEWKALKMRFQ